MRTKRKSGEKRVYQLKVTLRDVRPPIWRRIRVSSDTNLQQLHEILQAVMGWHGGHVHEFEVYEDSYGGPEVMDGEVLDEREGILGQLITDEKEELLYVYDFGDDWVHVILVEKILALQEGAPCPVCIAGKRACPLEDCGGAEGYENLLEILNDPSHPEHDAMFDWLPGDLDPEKFDIKSVNRKLAGLGAP